MTVMQGPPISKKVPWPAPGWNRRYPYFGNSKVRRNRWSNCRSRRNSGRNRRHRFIRSDSLFICWEHWRRNAVPFNIQMRLVLDMSVLYDLQLDTEDPEDILLIFGYALGVAPADVLGKGLQVAARAGTEGAIKKVVSKETLAALEKIRATTRHQNSAKDNHQICGSRCFRRCG